MDILHVDDDPSFGELVAEFLEREGDDINVVSATDPTDAVDRIRNEGDIDGVISDYDMPEQNGIELLRDVRANYPDLPFILFTGKGSEEVASEAISAGATDYLQKGGGTEQYELLANRVRNAVTQYRSTKEAEQTRRRLQTLAESTSHCVWMFDSDWEEVRFISGYEEVWNRPVDAIRDDPRKFLNSVHPDDREFVRTAMERMSNGEAIDIEYRILRGDGESGWVWVEGEPVFDDAGEVKSVVGFTRDVTDRKRREQRLQRYERIIENLPVGVFRTSVGGEFVSMNEQFVTVYDGKSKSDFVGVAPEDLYADDDTRAELLERLEQDGLVEDYHIEMETLDGEVKSMETTLRLTEEDGTQYLDGIVQDVTERRERTRRLEQAQTMFENAQDGLFLVDVDEGFVVERVNPAYEEATGFSHDTVEGRTPREILGDEAGTEVERRYERCIERRTTVEYEEELPIDGEPTYWDTRITPVVIDGDVEKIVGATRNITERKERERELRQSERRFQAIFNDPNILVGLLDADGVVTDINRTAMEYVDAELADVKGEPFWETPWWPEEREPAVRKNVERAARGEYVEYENHTTPDGKSYSVEGVIRPVTNESGDVVSLFVSARDVTERAVRETRLEAILENTTVPLFMKDRDGEYLMVNKGFEDLLELDAESIVGRTDADLFPDEVAREVQQNDERVLETGEPVDVEERLVVGDETRMFLSSKTPVHDIGTASDPEEPVAVFGVANEITEQKASEQRLERHNERFDQLASAVSHDLQTPLQTARGRVELAAETGEVEHLEEALDALERTDEIRESLVTVLRQNEIVNTREPVDIGRLSRDAWTTVTASDDATLRTDDPPTVEADPAALRRLVENLLSNAVEHGGGDVTVRIGSTGSGFFVADDGPGIPPDERDEVFRSGYSTKRDGSGVGLASVSQIVTAHGWEISITESSTGGTRFEIDTTR